MQSGRSENAVKSVARQCLLPHIGLIENRPGHQTIQVARTNVGVGNSGKDLNNRFGVFEYNPQY